MKAQEFYDALAERYHLLFEDWWSAAERHGEVVAAVLSSRGVASGRILDATCGVGTQALPLAGLGYGVTGADVSAASIARARAEADSRGLAVGLAVHDVRDPGLPTGFDAAISCDNALPHLLTDLDLDLALGNLWTCLRPSGLLLASIRDYDRLRQERPTGVPLAVHGVAGARHASGQSWRWADDGEHVDIEVFTLVEGADGTWTGESASTRYRALRRATLEAALTRAGFGQVEWLPPEVTGFYQPMVIATRR